MEGITQRRSSGSASLADPTLTCDELNHEIGPAVCKFYLANAPPRNSHKARKFVSGQFSHRFCWGSRVTGSSKLPTVVESQMTRRLGAYLVVMLDDVSGRI